MRIPANFLSNDGAQQSPETQMWNLIANRLRGTPNVSPLPLYKSRLTNLTTKLKATNLFNRLEMHSEKATFGYNGYSSYISATLRKCERKHGKNLEKQTKKRKETTTENLHLDR